MDWITIVSELRKRGETYESIAKACGFKSRGHVHDVANGNQKRVTWENGDALLRFHRKVMRRKETKC